MGAVVVPPSLLVHVTRRLLPRGRLCYYTCVLCCLSNCKVKFMKPETIIRTSSQEVTDQSRINIEQYNMATSVVHNCLARLIGRTMTLVEGIGLPAKQEEAIKRSIKDNMKDTRHDIDAALFERLFPGDAAMMPPVAYTFHDDPIENA